MISKLWKLWKRYRERREFEIDRRSYLAYLQASLDAGLIDQQQFEMKAEQWGVIITPERQV